MFAEAASRAGGTPAFVEQGETRLSYAGLDAAVGGYAAALRARGARPGDRVLVQAEKSVEVALLYLACLRAGLRATCSAGRRPTWSTG